MQKPVKPPTEEDRDNITLSLKKGYGEISGVSSGAVTILFPQPKANSERFVSGIRLYACRSSI
jgi:hypothetical protein